MQDIDKNKIIDESFNSATSRNMQELSALSLRLDTRPILEDIEQFLSGRKKITRTNAEGNVEEVTMVRSRPKANEEGIHGILSYLESVFNSAVVMGNFDEFRYEQFIMEVHQSIATILMINKRFWNVTSGDYPLIISTVMNIVQPFISRLLHNKERESLMRTVQINESNTINERQKSGWFGGGMK